MLCVYTAALRVFNEIIHIFYVITQIRSIALTGLENRESTIRYSMHFLGKWIPVN